MTMNFTFDKISIVKFNVTTNKKLFMMIIFVLCVILIKLLYQWANKVTKYFPESSLLLFLGIGFGFVNNYFGIDSVNFEVDSFIFMYILLPPIVLESAFAMYHADFMANIIGVLIFAIVATILNFILLSITLYALMAWNVLQDSINTISILLFSSLITSVDPVAVLAIFQQIQVDNNLYYLVFGESLLNDGVCVVLYSVLKELASIDSWNGMHYFKSVVAFIAVAVGGGMVGTIISSVTCIMSRYTYSAPLAEPLIVFSMSMIAYLIADTLGWSTIISMITYGLIQVAYNFHNITHKSLVVIKRLAKIMANLAESVIFLNLGVTLSTSETIEWWTPFMMWSLFLCVYVRFIVTFFLSAFINSFKLTVRRIEWNEQFIMSYGGMRGGIAYILAILLKNEYEIDTKSIQSATIFIVIFTTVFMGITMKPLVAMLEIKIAGMEKLNLIDQINNSVVQHTLANIEAIIDSKGRYSFKEFANQVNGLFIRPLFQRNPVNYEYKLLEIYKAIDFRLYMAYASGYGTDLAQHYFSKLKENLQKPTYGFYDLRDLMEISKFIPDNMIDVNEGHFYDLSSAINDEPITRSGPNASLLFAKLKKVLPKSDIDEDNIMESKILNLKIPNESEFNFNDMI